MGELKVFFPLVICFFHTEENYISYLSQLIEGVSRLIVW